MCSCDYDPPRVFHHETPKANKAHGCEECGALIAPGSQYHRYWGIGSEGDSFSSKCCALCYALDRHMRKVSDCFCPAFGGLFEEVREDAANQGTLTPDLVRAYRMMIEAKRQPKFPVLCSKRHQGDATGQPRHSYLLRGR